ncbi:MAG: hypothetical protein K2Z81_18640 [Cyanobacteria bacterium]|nr:hypothetical protein [Cyanobacteriota bacterium]
MNYDASGVGQSLNLIELMNGGVTDTTDSENGNTSQEGGLSFLGLLQNGVQQGDSRPGSSGSPTPEASPAEQTDLLNGLLNLARGRRGQGSAPESASTPEQRATDSLRALSGSLIEMLDNAVPSRSARPNSGGHERSGRGSDSNNGNRQSGELPQIRADRVANSEESNRQRTDADRTSRENRPVTDTSNRRTGEAPDRSSGIDSNQIHDANNRRTGEVPNRTENGSTNNIESGSNRRTGESTDRSGRESGSVNDINRRSGEAPNRDTNREGNDRQREREGRPESPEAQLNQQLNRLEALLRNGRLSADAVGEIFKSIGQMNLTEGDMEAVSGALRDFNRRLSTNYGLSLDIGFEGRVGQPEVRVGSILLSDNMWQSTNISWRPGQDAPRSYTHVSGFAGPIVENIPLANAVSSFTSPDQIRFRLRMMRASEQ